MSRLINCPTCSHKVSSDAESCPNCGHKLNDGFVEKTTKKIFIGLLIFFGIAAVIIIAIADHDFALGMLIMFGVLIAGGFISWLLKNPKQW